MAQCCVRLSVKILSLLNSHSDCRGTFKEERLQYLCDGLPHEQGDGYEESLSRGKTTKFETDLEMGVKYG